MNELNHIVNYCRWIPSIYSNLSESFRLKKKEEMMSYYQKIADNLKTTALNKSETKCDLLNVEMYKQPPKNLNEFIVSLI